MIQSKCALPAKRRATGGRRNRHVVRLAWSHSIFLFRGGAPLSPDECSRGGSIGGFSEF